MIRFKQFLFITEETVDKFTNIKDVEGSPGGKLDPNNPVHQQMASLYGNIQKGERKIVGTDGNTIHMKNAQDIKSFHHLHQLVYPHMQDAANTAQHREDDRNAMESGEAELIHHNPDNGMKIYKVHSAAGSCAAAAADGKDDTKWCTTSREKDQNAFDYYARGEDKKSFVIHLPKEKGNLRKIGIYGVRPWDESSIEQGVGGNFQDKGNNTIRDKDWHRIRHQYNLGSIKELEGIRGVGIEKKNVEDMMNSGKGSEITQALKYHPDIKEHHVDNILSRTSMKHHKFSSDLRAAAVQSPGATKNHIDKVLGMHGNTPDHVLEVQEAAIQSPAAAKEHIEHVLNNHNTDYGSTKLRELAIENPLATKDHIDRVLGMNGNKLDGYDVRISAMNNPNFTKEHLDHILGMNGNKPDTDSGVRRRAIEHRHITKEHISHVLGMNGNNPDPNYSVRISAIRNKRADKEHIEHVLGMNGKEWDEMAGVREAALQSPHITKEHISHVLGMNGSIPDPDDYVRGMAIQSPHATKEHIDHVLGMNGGKVDKSLVVKDSLMQSPHITKEHIDHILSMSDNNNGVMNHIQAAAIQHKHATKETISKVLGMNGSIPNQYTEVREDAFKNPNATKEHVDHVLGMNGNPTDNAYVRTAAIESPHATKEHLDYVMGINGNKPDKFDLVRKGVFKNPLHTKEHVDKALGMHDGASDSSVYIREAALESPHATREHFQQAIKDPFDSVRSIAGDKLRKLRKKESKAALESPNVQEGMYMDRTKKITDSLNRIHQRVIKRTGISPPVKTVPTKKSTSKSKRQPLLQLITSRPTL